MLKQESHFFLQIPSQTKKRALHPAKAVSQTGSLYTAVFEEKGPVLDKEMDVFIYFELERKFMGQAARIGSLLGSDPDALFEFETVGDPFSAENREALRVSLVGTDIMATFGGEKHCEVLDISSKGFAVYGTREHKVGSQVKATLFFEGKEFKGSVSIISAIELKGKIRYGVHPIDDPKSGSNLKNNLGRITMAIQRQQLARLARTE